MRVFSILFALAAVGGLAVNTSYAQYHPVPTQGVAKHPHFSPPAAPTSRHGSVGGPATKPGGVGGVTNKPGGINGTVRPKY
jgi:hypothetical protein